MNGSNGTGLRAVTEVLRAITVVRELDPLLELVVDKAVALVPARACAVVLQSAGRFRVQHAAGLDAAVIGLQEQGFDPLFRRLTALARTTAPEEAACLPMVSGGRVIGVLCVFAGPDGRFTDDEVETISILADQAAIAIANASLYEALVAHRQYLFHAHQHADSRFRTILDHMADGLILFSHDGRVLEISASARALLDLDNGTRPARPIRIKGPRRQARCASLPALHRLLLEELPGTVFQLETMRGNRACDAVLTPMTTPEGLREHVVLVRDITLYKRMEELKSTFLSTAAHDIRTPVTAVHGYLSLILSGRLGDPASIPPPIRQALESVQASIQRLLTLVNDLLDITRMERSQPDLRPEDIDVAGLLRTNLAEIEVFSQDRRIEVTATIPDGIGRARWDGRRVSQVIMNLLTNAIKFTPAGGGVRVTLSSGDEHVRFGVADSGPGIPAGQHGQVFEPFWQADGMRERGSSGLGLTICRRIVEAHRGRIWVESEPGAGATFFVELPRRL